MSPRFFPVVLLVLQLCAAGRWAIARDPGQTIIWIADAAITCALTFLLKGTP